MTWKVGWDIRKEKQKTAEELAVEKRKAQNRAKKEAFRNIISAAIGQELVSLKDIANRMGKETKAIKRDIKIMCDQGVLFADHSKAVVQYRIAE